MIFKEYLFDTKNYFTFYQIDDSLRPCAIIAPGGGYDHTSLVESENVAMFFNELGINACVINYRETLDLYPFPQKCYQYVVNQVRNNPKYKAIKDKLIGVGFSAGGHLVLSSQLKDYGYESHLNFLVLGYPVVSTNDEIWHKGSFLSLTNGDEKLYNILGLENNITDKLGDVFLWTTFTDESVNCLNSIYLLEKLKEKNINTEFHMFPLGGHGLSLADESVGKVYPSKVNPYIATWKDMLKNWLKLKL